MARNRNEDVQSSSELAGKERYECDRLAHIAFPLGGLGAGMICIEGSGALSKFSLFHRPNLQREPLVFAALSVQGQPRLARVLEGPVPEWKFRPQFPGEWGLSPPVSWGLPRFRAADFEARFPFGEIRLKDDEHPCAVEITGWSPFSPGDTDTASLPVAALEYTFTNRSTAAIDATFSWHSENFMAQPRDPMSPALAPRDRVHTLDGGFRLSGPGSRSPELCDGQFAAWVDDPQAQIDHAWFRGGWVDALRMVWNQISSNHFGTHPPLPSAASPGASIWVPFSLAPGARKKIIVHLAWFVPDSDLHEPRGHFSGGKFERYATPRETYQPWYAGRFEGMEQLIRYWRENYGELRKSAQRFADTFENSTLPREVIEAVAANLSILKSPTVLRQRDGRLWGWEGSYDSIGSCYGTSTHVWNYAQALAHLFPALERGLRETELSASQSEDGRQFCRTSLPIRTIDAAEEGGPAGAPAADGQCGGIIKCYREWRISGDTAWLRTWWPRIRASLDFCIRTWDPDRRGWLDKPHINTYDIEFHGPDSLCTSLYLGALQAAIAMGAALGESTESYATLLKAGRARLERQLFNGEYFFQEIHREREAASMANVMENASGASVEAFDLIAQEGPSYQYGSGCLSDGVMGEWLNAVCGVEGVLNCAKVESHLLAVHRHNFIRNLKQHANISRVIFAHSAEAGLVLCTWPRGGRPSLPFFYAEEVWTGVEYQVASHLILLGRVAEGLEIVRACRHRYDGRARNPFDEVEAGHWYARAMASYALLQAFSGARFDAVEKTLYLKPAISGDFKCFLATATGYGTVGVENGKPFVRVAHGEIPFERINYTAHIAEF